MYVSLTQFPMWWPFLLRHYPPSSVLFHHPTPYPASACLTLLSLGSAYSLFLERLDRVSQVDAYSQCPTCHVLGPRRDKIAPTILRYPMVTSAGSTASSLALKLSRLNHFSFRLRPAVSITLCLTFGITPAGPRFSYRWLACLAGPGFPPAEIRDLAWPHCPPSLF